MTIPPRAWSTREIVYTGPDEDIAEHKPYLIFIILSSSLGAIIALAVLWATLTAPSRAPVRAAPAPISQRG